MSDFRLQSRVTWAPRDIAGRFVDARIRPGAVAATEAVTRGIFDRSQELVAVRSGELKSSGRYEIVETGKTVVGRVIYDSEHAPFVEYGTGQRGASSPMAGAGPYRPDWPGMAPQPFIRPAADEARGKIVATYKINLTLK